jgi:peptidoglycan/LPS O-acetylase OafA/YrhL
MRPFVQRLSLSVATGVIFVYWSELAFWARPYAGTTLAEMAPTTIAYSVAAYLFLAIVSSFQARTPPAIFLAGALFGWFVEGVIVQTMVEDLPLSISFTGLAWHASITVMVGWWLIPRRLAEQRLGKLALLCSAIGLIYGFWSLTWWVETPPPSPPVDFAVYVFRTTLLLAAAYALAFRLRAEPFAPSRLEWLGLSAMVLLYFAFVTVPAAPLTLLVLPPLGALALVALRSLSRRRSDTTLEVSRTPAPPLRAFAPLVLIPASATAVYALAFALDVRAATGIVLYLVATPLGFILLGWSCWRAFSRGKPAPVVTESVDAG